MMNTTDIEAPEPNKPFNFDISKSSKFNSNVWVLCVLIVFVIMAVTALRDLQETDRTTFKEILQMQKDSAREQLELLERDRRQEKHLEFADARIDQLERKSIAVERTVDVIANNVSWLRQRTEYQDKKDAAAGR